MEVMAKVSLVQLTDAAVVVEVVAMAVVMVVTKQTLPVAPAPLFSLPKSNHLFPLKARCYPMKERPKKWIL